MVFSSCTIIKQCPTRNAVIVFLCILVSTVRTHFQFTSSNSQFSSTNDWRAHTFSGLVHDFAESCSTRWAIEKTNSQRNAESARIRSACHRPRALRRRNLGSTFRTSGHSTFTHSNCTRSKMSNAPAYIFSARVTLSTCLSRLPDVLSLRLMCLLIISFASFGGPHKYSSDA